MKKRDLNAPHKERIKALGWFIFPLFSFHMLLFGGVSFFMTYFSNGEGSISAAQFSIIPIAVYLFFYLMIFGLEKVKLMFINSALGVFGIYCELKWVLNYSGKHITEFAWSDHIIPSVYYILYTFLIHQAALHFSGSNDNLKRKQRVEVAYIGLSIIIYLAIYFNS